MDINFSRFLIIFCDPFCCHVAAENLAYTTITGSNLPSTDTAYNFSVTVTNFLGESDTEMMSVVRSAENKPDVVIIPERVDTDNALVSEP